MIAARPSRWRYWLLAAALSLANPLLHKPISNVCDWARARWGFPLYNRTALILISALSLLAITPMLAQRAGVWRRPRALAAVAVLSVVTLAAQRWMIVANIELIHFPQFALLAGLLRAAGLAGETAWLVATAAGVLDETYQHLVIYAGRTDTYLDFNDMVLNAVGAAWAVVVLADGSPRTDPRRGVTGSNADSGRLHRWLRWPHGAVALLLALAVALWMDPPQMSPLLRRALGSDALYHVFSAAEGIIAGALLWKLVALVVRARNAPSCGAGGSGGMPRATTSPPGSHISPRSPFSIGGLLLVLLALSGCAAWRPLPGSAGPDDPPFIITFWCGPPLAQLDAARAAEIAAAGFTVVGPPCEGGADRERNRRALNIAAEHGLRLWVTDPRINQHTATQPDWESRIAAAAADYGGHPALDGYFVMDEPSADEFDGLAPVVAALHDASADDLAYVNLLPDYVTPEGLGTQSYREYVERFLTTVRPRLLSYDYYPFGKTTDRPTFFANLTSIRELAAQHRIPFMLIVLAMPHGPYRDPTEAELSWQVFHALAFGARGISYFAYWTPVNVPHADEWQFRHGLIENGQPTLHYYQAARLNGVLRAITEQLAAFRSVTVGDSLGEVAAPFPIGPIAAIDGGAVTAGFFTNETGQLRVLLVNRDYRSAATITLRLRHDAPLPARFDVETRGWRPLDDGTMRLPAGGAQLVRWPRRS